MQCIEWEKSEIKKRNKQTHAMLKINNAHYSLDVCKMIGCNLAIQNLRQTFD